jgi:hypothetical protein
MKKKIILSLILVLCLLSFNPSFAASTLPQTRGAIVEVVTNQVHHTEQEWVLSQTDVPVEIETTQSMHRTVTANSSSEAISKVSGSVGGDTFGFSASVGAEVTDSEGIMIGNKYSVSYSVKVTYTEYFDSWKLYEKRYRTVKYVDSASGEVISTSYQYWDKRCIGTELR